MHEKLGENVVLNLLLPVSNEAVENVLETWLNLENDPKLASFVELGYLECSVWFCTFWLLFEYHKTFIHSI